MLGGYRESLLKAEVVSEGIGYQLIMTARGCIYPTLLLLPISAVLVLLPQQKESSPSQQQEEVQNKKERIRVEVGAKREDLLAEFSF